MEIAININQAVWIASGLGTENQKLRGYYSAVLSAAARCPLSGNAKTSLMRTLKSIAAEMENECRTLSDMQKALNTSAQMYQKCEQKLAKSGGSTSVNWGSLANASVSLDTGSTQTKSPTEGAFQWDWYENVISKFGSIGNGVSAVGNIVSGNHDAKGILSSLKYVNSMIGGAASAVSENGTSGAWMKSLAGLGNGLKDLDLSSPGKTFASSMKKQFGSDLDFTGAKTTAEKVKVGTEWMGHVITVAQNGVENYQEMKETGMSVERMIDETVIESVVDIIVGAGSTAVASAIAGAAAAAMPAVASVVGSAVVIGVGAAVISWGANGFCKWVTGAVTGEQKDLGELIADTVCDVGEAAVQVKKTIETKAANAVKNVGSKIVSGITAGWSGICSAFA